MMFSSRFATFVMVLVAAVSLHATYVRAAPLASESSTLIARDSLSDHGSSCTYWREQEPNGYWRIYMKCDKIGRGLKVSAGISYNSWGIFTSSADYNSLGKVVQSPPYNADLPLEQLNFRFTFSASGMPDMGSCDSDLIEVDQTIKNAWYNSMTCTDISPYLKVRAVLDLPGAFDQYSQWIQTPGTVKTLERESWFGQPRAYAEWEAR